MPLPAWSRSVRLLTLSLLYFVQGAPYGFQTACLPIILREERTAVPFVPNSFS